MSGFGVQTHGLVVAYRHVTALRDVTLDLAPGAIHALLGRNGAGKTTLLSTLAALRQPTAGRVLVDGEDPFENERVTEAVCLVRESGDVFTDERLRVTLAYLAAARPTWDQEYADRLMQAFRLDPRAKPTSLSRGQRSAFGVVVGLASRCPLTMFDEVHLGMDAPSRQRFYDELLADYAAHPRTIILSSHLINEIEHLVESIVILDNDGHVRLTGDSESVRARGVTLTGPVRAVETAAMAAGQPVVGRRQLGGTLQVTLFGTLDEAVLDRAQAAGLDIGPVPLQDLFIHLTDNQPTREHS